MTHGSGGPAPSSHQGRTYRHDQINHDRPGNDLCWLHRLQFWRLLRRGLQHYHPESNGNCGPIIDEWNGLRTICGLSRGTTTGSIANETGDSGGPVIKQFGSSVYAMGIVSSSDPGSERSCQTYVAQTCFTTLYYTGIFAALDHFGATLNTP